jgi:hypothetical protein
VGESTLKILVGTNPFSEENYSDIDPYNKFIFAYFFGAKQTVQFRGPGPGNCRLEVSARFGNRASRDTNNNRLSSDRHEAFLQVQFPGLVEQIL